MNQRLKMAGLILIIAATLLAAFPILDQDAESSTAEGFKRALVTFALARALNGIISVVQGTELALQPAGVGVTLTPGELLDPLNDLIERFSWIMLASSTSLGVQNILLEVSAWWGLKLVVILMALAAAWAWFSARSDDPGSVAIRQWLIRAFTLALFLRLAVPLVVIANDTVYQVFLEPRYQESSQMIQQASEELESISQEQEQQESKGFLNSVNKALESVKIKQRLERFKQRTTEIIEHVITLSAVFILQTVVLPLLFLWLLWVLFKRLLIWPQRTA